MSKPDAIALFCRTSGLFERRTCSLENVFVPDRLHGSISQFPGSAKGDKVSRLFVWDGGM
jgi:hypothetical protein